MTRMNITVPDELVRELSHVKNKSRFIAEAVHARFETLKRSCLEALMIEGYKASAKGDRELNQEWERGTLRDGLDE